MSKNRMINTRFWNDSFVVDHLNPLDRYLFQYLLTNDKTNISGIYELPVRMIANETGLDREEITKMLKRLEPKVHYRDGWVVIANMIKHQNYKNSKIAAGIQREMCNAKPELIELVNIPSDFNMDFSCPVEPKKMSHDESSMTNDVSNNNYNTNSNLIKSNSNSIQPESKPVHKSNDDNRTTGLKKGSEQYKEADILFEDLSDLVNEQFRKWYLLAFHKVGRERVLRFASEARADGKDPKKLFSHLLTKETGQKAIAK